MNPEATDLARRLCAHPRFEWASGMLDSGGWRVLYVDPDDGLPRVAMESEQAWSAEGPPDLDDAATAGVLLAMLGPCWVVSAGSVHSEDRFVIEPATDRGLGQIEYGEVVLCAPTLGEALALALLAVWGDDRI